MSKYFGKADPETMEALALDFISCCNKKHRVLKTWRLQDYHSWAWYFIQESKCKLCDARLFATWKFDEKDRRHPEVGADQVTHKKHKHECSILIDGRIAQECLVTPGKKDDRPTRGRALTCEWNLRAKSLTYILKWLENLDAPALFDKNGELLQQELCGGRGNK